MYLVIFELFLDYQTIKVSIWVNEVYIETDESIIITFGLDVMIMVWLWCGLNVVVGVVTDESIIIKFGLDIVIMQSLCS